MPRTGSPTLRWRGCRPRPHPKVTALRRDHHPDGCLNPQAPHKGTHQFGSGDDVHVGTRARAACPIAGPSRSRPPSPPPGTRRAQLAAVENHAGAWHALSWGRRPHADNPGRQYRRRVAAAAVVRSSNVAWPARHDVQFLARLRRRRQRTTVPLQSRSPTPGRGRRAACRGTRPAGRRAQHRRGRRRRAAPDHRPGRGGRAAQLAGWLVVRARLLAGHRSATHSTVAFEQTKSWRCPSWARSCSARTATTRRDRRRPGHGVGDHLLGQGFTRGFVAGVVSPHLGAGAARSLDLSSCPSPFAGGGLFAFPGFFRPLAKRVASQPNTFHRSHVEVTLWQVYRSTKLRLG